jgi:uncharacterized iron-regulated membrane protein
MLRRWHRLIAPFFAAFLLIIAVTGLGIQTTALLDKSDQAEKAKTGKGGVARPDKAVEGGSQPAAAVPCLAKPKRSELGQWNHWLKDLHSGAIAGGVGTVINILTAAALLFFAVSGFWMYLTMWLRRRRR